MRRCTPLASRFASALAAVVCTAGASAASESIIGICPDGSMFIVKTAKLIPCRDAKLVRPDEVPPLKGEYLPRPYAWEIFHRRTDPNNPYNLIDAARQARSAGESTGDAPGEGPQPPGVSTGPQARPQPAAPTAAPPPPALALDASELRDLALIVDLAQERAPASFSRTRADGSPGLVLQIARSQAFEARLQRGSAGASRGAVLLFSATAAEAQPFHPNLTFVQGHVAFHPDAGDPDQLGILFGSFDRVAPDEPALGYAVLPAHLDMARPIDIYWDDRRITAQLTP